MNADGTLLDDALRLQSDLTSLGRFLELLPLESRVKAQSILKRIEQDTRRRRQLLLSIQESLSQMRLDMKYLMFDLEATRRERDAYREQSGGGEGDFT